MKLADNWRGILLHAWTIRMSIAIAVGQAFVAAASSGPDRWIFTVTLVAQLVVIVLRVLDQKDFPNG
jgi:hypothetical protein